MLGALTIYAAVLGLELLLAGERAGLAFFVASALGAIGFYLNMREMSDDGLTR